MKSRLLPDIICFRIWIESREITYYDPNNCFPFCVMLYNFSSIFKRLPSSLFLLKSACWRISLLYAKPDVMKTIYYIMSWSELTSWRKLSDMETRIIKWLPRETCDQWLTESYPDLYLTYIITTYFFASLWTIGCFWSKPKDVCMYVYILTLKTDQ